MGDVGIMVADCSDEASLSTMCSAARIILNCVGPVGENFLSFTLLMAGPHYRIAPIEKRRTGKCK